MKFNYLLFCFIILLGCESDDNSSNSDPVNVPEVPLVITPNILEINEDDMQKGYVLGVVSGGSVSYLLDKGGNKVKEWSFSKNLGNDLQILDNGNLLGIFKDVNPAYTFGGFGGIINLMNSDGEILWEYTYSDNIVLAHHDVEMLPNGNILFLAWEKVDSNTAQNNGLDASNAIYPETLIEVNPNTNQIVWKWNSMDHLVQDFNATASNFGNVSLNTQLIDINYNSAMPNGDIMHANGIDYDVQKDIIYLSVNNYSEVWVIDHSTTTSEAASHTGGNYNKGGDLLYRFGNPEAYKNSQGQRLFYKNHHPNLIPNDRLGDGNILVYMNGINNNQSVVYELNIPDDFQLQPNTNNEPSVVWSFTDEDLFFQRVSGAVRLKNGNTLICEGDLGFWEVNTSGDVVWKYSKLEENISFWRGYDYYFDDEAINNLGL